MRLALSDDQEQLRAVARDMLSSATPLPALVSGAALTADARASIWKQIAALGWLGVGIAQTAGGEGYSLAELALLAGEFGRALVPLPFISVAAAAYARFLGGGMAEELAAVLRGDQVSVLDLSGLARAPAYEPAVRYECGRLSGAVRLPIVGAGDELLVVAASPDGAVLAAVLADADGVTAEQLESVDLTQPISHVRLRAARAEVVLAAGRLREAAPDILDRAAVLLAFDQLGVAERAHALAVAHVRTRVQFGKPIGSFQAIRHRLANLYVSIELARSNCYYAVAEDAGREAPALALLTASGAAQAASRECVHLHGGMGFTWESGIHLLLRRAETAWAHIGGRSLWTARLLAAARELGGPPGAKDTPCD